MYIKLGRQLVDPRPQRVNQMKDDNQVNSFLKRRIQIKKKKKTFQKLPFAIEKIWELFCVALK